MTRPHMNAVLGMCFGSFGFRRNQRWVLMVGFDPLGYQC
eukprot:UN22152